MKQINLHKVLIANRGEIAVRIMNTLKRMGISSVAVYHALDADAQHVRLADEAMSLGEGELRDTYLNIEKIIQLAKKAGADAIHPGYGFLSENPLFADACVANGLLFIGPEAATMRLMGNKISARNHAVKCGLPVTQGISGTKEEILSKADSIDFPLLVKAAAGGGGKGMKIVYNAGELADVLDNASREAMNYFGDPTVYVEKFIEEPRHIEIQVLGDNFGNVVHLFERECSIQRRYQKIIEESPSPTLTQEVREKMGEAAVNICRDIGYRSAGTIEFLVDKNLHFYFLEMNTRIQVEHPVTELVTGIDLVEEQLMIVQGKPLRMQQSDIKQLGHAIECRIYAEDPLHNFMPSPGKITNYHRPVLDNIRVDQSVDGPTEIFSLFDPMISKLVAWGKDRNDAIYTIGIALQQYVIQGIRTNIPYLRQLLQHPAFALNQISTKFCDDHTSQLVEVLQLPKSAASFRRSIGAFLLYQERQSRSQHKKNVWNELGYWRQNMVFEVRADEKTLQVALTENKPDAISGFIDGEQFSARLHTFEPTMAVIETNESIFKAYISVNDEGLTLVTIAGESFTINRKDQLNDSIDYALLDSAEDAGNLFSPMPGKIIKINVIEGDVVKRGTILLVVEAMKMENNIVASQAAIVEKVNVKVGEMVNVKTQLIHLKEVDTSDSQHT
ncbi:MAG: ATP-grasp domain-containing protein [Bacteroidales bacterium]|nr:ATP-grasp domain-containing protein [Bacteroidales bacterium]